MHASQQLFQYKIRAWFTWFLNMAKTSRYVQIHCGFDMGRALLWKNKKTKTQWVYFRRATILCSLVDERSWIYETKAVSAVHRHLSWQMAEKHRVATRKKKHKDLTCRGNTLDKMSVTTRCNSLSSVTYRLCSWCVWCVFIVSLVFVLLFPLLPWEYIFLSSSAILYQIQTDIQLWEPCAVILHFHPLQ